MPKVPIQSKVAFSNYISSLKALEKDSGVYNPNLDDLYSLYSHVRSHRKVAVFEIGSGWSSIALAKALKENLIEFGSVVAETIRHPNPFKLLTLDASRTYLDISVDRLVRAELGDIVIPIHSTVGMTIMNSQVCHVFDNIPPFTADFVYLDGPDCDQVAGSINGFHVRFGMGERKFGLPMSADLLLIEPYFWPGTSIIVDGRGANARFLQQNFKRSWLYSYDSNLDQHHFLLDEPSWGAYSTALTTLQLT